MERIFLGLILSVALTISFLFVIGRMEFVKKLTFQNDRRSDIILRTLIIGVIVAGISTGILITYLI